MVQRTEATEEQRAILTALGMAEPCRVLQMTLDGMYSLHELSTAPTTVMSVEFFGICMTTKVPGDSRGSRYSVPLVSSAACA